MNSTLGRIFETLQPFGHNFMTDTPQTTYHHGNLREALLEAAETALEEQGVEKLSLRALARSVGVSQTAPYRHFADKNALLAALATSGFERLFKLADSSNNPSGEVIEQLRQLGHRYVQFALKNPETFRLMFGPMLKPRRSYEALFRAGQAAYRSVDTLIQQGCDQKIFRDDGVPYMTNTVWVGIHGLATLALDRLEDSFGHHVELDIQIEKSMTHVIDGLRPDRTRDH